MANFQKQALAKTEASLKNQANRVQVRTYTEAKFTSHLQDLLKEGAQQYNNDKKFGLTYGHSILANVVYERYDRAIDDLDRILDLQLDYPDFGERATPYVKHAKSLVKALKAKRAIGKLPHVSRAKQKELIGALTVHFKDLRACIVNIEKIERQIRRLDISATKYFVVVFFWSFFFTFNAGFLVYGLPLYWPAINGIVTQTIADIVIAFTSFIWPF